MILHLKRFHETKDDTLGLLYINGSFSNFVIEDEGRDAKVMHETRIPAGKYRLILVHSPKFTPRYGHEMILLKDVPGFTGILIHPGNDEGDTSGCLLPGNTAHLNPNGKSHLSDSTVCYNRIYPIIRMGIEHEGAWIVVENPTQVVPNLGTIDMDKMRPDRLA